ncbi:MAG: hypothetical protein KKC38_02175 [Nanoarchaeota archaeon]|nr:hypothetical protein [Nanoarchaeota archaeon]
MVIDYSKLDPETGCLEEQEFEKVLSYLRTDEGKENMADVLRRIPKGDRDAILNDIVEGSRIVF